MSVDRDKLYAIVEKIPAFPESVHRVLELTSSLDTPPKAIVGVIEHDPILTMRLLNTVNSPYFGLAREVSSIKQAVVYVGMNTVKNVAITVATAGVLPNTSKAGLDVTHVWLHSLRAGVIAKLVARRNGIAANEIASYFVAGLLHDIGKIVCAEYLASEYKTVLEKASELAKPIVVLEREILGTDHAEVGALVAEKWKLPADLIQAIRCHHGLVDGTALPVTPSSLTLGVCFGNMAAHYLEFMEAEDSALDSSEIAVGVQTAVKLPAVVKAWAGGEIADVLDELPGLAEEIQKAQTFMIRGAA